MHPTLFVGAGVVAVGALAAFMIPRGPRVTVAIEAEPELAPVPELRLRGRSRLIGEDDRFALRVDHPLGHGNVVGAEFVALTQLQADAFITSDSDLARAISGLVKTATIDALRTA